MILVTGGYAAGKRTWVRDHLPGREVVFFGPSEARDALKDLQKETGEKAVQDAALRLLADHPEAVLITQEIGCGVVPLDPMDRTLREALGRAQCALAEHAECVVYITCGIGQVIRGELK